ncbi:MAG: nicotinate-nucleotide adenylyltransferase [Pseudomonadota bacterium]
MPLAVKGMRIGLFGGSFNPPHDGHLLISKLALRKLQLDRIWWIVSPGNPLKEHSSLARLPDRLAACREITDHPRIDVTAFEVDLDSAFTANTLDHARERRPGVDFVWIMGADNLKQFHEWQRWRDIAQTMPIAVVDRPGSTLSYRSAKAALALARYRIDETDAALLANMNPPAWTFLHGPRSHLSSSAIRANREQKAR